MTVLPMMIWLIDHFFPCSCRWPSSEWQMCDPAENHLPLPVEIWVLGHWGKYRGLTTSLSNCLIFCILLVPMNSCIVKFSFYFSYVLPTKKSISYSFKHIVLPTLKFWNSLHRDRLLFQISPVPQLMHAQNLLHVYVFVLDKVSVVSISTALIPSVQQQYILSVPLCLFRQMMLSYLEGNSTAPPEFSH